MAGKMSGTEEYRNKGKEGRAQTSEKDEREKKEKCVYVEGSAKHTQVERKARTSRKGNPKPTKIKQDGEHETKTCEKEKENVR